MDLFDPGATFNDDYLWFYEPLLTPERSHSEVERIESILGLPDGASILDAPCGHGRIANLLAARFQVTGLDRSEWFVHLARVAGQAQPNVNYMVGDLRNLPCAQHFDAVLCWFTSFGYFDDAGNRACLAEFARVLRPGGVLLIDTLQAMRWFGGR